MHTPNVPDTAFITPQTDNTGARELALDAVRRIIDIAEQAETRTSMPAEATLPSVAISEHGCSDRALLAGLETLLEHSMNPAHTGWLAHMDPMPALASALADFAAAVANNNMLSVEMAPAVTQLEQALMRELATLFGLGEHAGGLMLSGGSLANMQALAVARNAAFDDVANAGLHGLGARPVLLASDGAHTSLHKAAMLLGLGRDAVRSVATDTHARMQPQALRASIEAAKARGERPFCVVATAGTTTTGSMDPLAAIAAVCHEHDLWLHVDAAYGGALAFSRRHRALLQGIEQADSITFNPQKWLYVAKTCATLLFRDARAWHAHFRVDAPYMAQDATLVNLGEVGIQGTRHADALKLWATLQHLGRLGIEQLVDEGIRLAQWFAEQLRQRPQLRLAANVTTNIVCFRGEPDELDAALWDDWNRNLQVHLQATCHVFLSLPTLGGGRWLRMVVLNPRTDTQQLKALIDAIDRYIDAPV